MLGAGKSEGIYIDVYLVIQGDQLNMAGFFYSIVKSDLSSVHKSLFKR